MKAFFKASLHVLSRLITVFFALLMGALALFVVMLLFVAPLVNNLTASGTARDILSLPLPAETELIEKKSLAGKLEGCGNGMQYLGAVLIRSGLSLDELQEHYDGCSGEEREYSVEPQKTRKIKMSEHVPFSFDAEIDGNDYYIVYSWGSAGRFWADFDLRGH